jgi:hypothetical protein
MFVLILSECYFACAIPPWNIFIFKLKSKKQL